MLFFLVFVRSAARDAVRKGYARNQKELEAQWEETNSSAPFVTGCYVQEGPQASLHTWDEVPLLQFPWSPALISAESAVEEPWWLGSFIVNSVHKTRFRILYICTILHLAD